MPILKLHNGLEVECLPVPRQALEISAERYAYRLPGPDATPDRLNSASLELLHHQMGVAFLLAFPHVQAPDGWELPDGIIFAGIEPRPGPIGHRADYIQFGLLADPTDYDAAQRLMSGVEEETEAGIDAAAGTFRPETQRPETVTHSARSREQRRNRR